MISDMIKAIRSVACRSGDVALWYVGDRGLYVGMIDGSVWWMMDELSGPVLLVAAAKKLGAT